MYGNILFIAKALEAERQNSFQALQIYKRIKLSAIRVGQYFLVNSVRQYSVYSQSSGNREAEQFSSFTDLQKDQNNRPLGWVDIFS